MAVTKVIRYKTKSESADENERLIRNVFAELAQESPEGLRYAAFRLDDRVTFLHVAVLDVEANPLSTSAAFHEFQSDLKDRCAEGPTPADASVIGNYGLLPD